MKEPEPASSELDETGGEKGPDSKARGFWLAGYLVLVCLSNPLTIYYYLTSPESVIQLFPRLDQGLLYVLCALSATSILMAVAIWNWKKWGVFGFYAMAAISFVTNLYVGVGFLAALFGLCGALLIYVTTKRRWQHFS